MKIDEVLNLLWDQYTAITPQAKEVHNLLLSSGEEKIVNDHIAFRTIESKKIGINTLSSYFEVFGYKKSGEYYFEEKKVRALHLENEQADLPKIFISEIIPSQLSKFSQKICDKIISRSPSDGLIFTGSPWDKTYSIYKKLYQESEYLAWVYLHGFVANHFTVSVNNLKNFNTLEEVNSLLKKNGFNLNNFGGEIKGTPSDLLEQSSTMAQKIELTFTDGVYSVPSCFYEFARRYPMENKILFPGFLAKNANKIFESTKES